MSERSRKSETLALAAGLRVRSTSSASVPWAVARARWKHRASAFWIAKGGSCPIGTIGFVDAGLELAEQIRAGELVEPSAIVVACGTGGTVAGLMAGCRLAGLKSRVVGVRVMSRVVCNERAITRLANATLTQLRKAGLPRKAGAFEPSDVSLIHSAYGPGHARAALEAISVARDLEQLPLEPVYTGKAMSALLRMVLDGPEDAGPLLFWHTAPW